MVLVARGEGGGVERPHGGAKDHLRLCCSYVKKVLVMAVFL